jgi:alcohol dehydrogenase, propanol-preferring
LLWGERVLRSVANLTKQDAVEFLALARHAGINPAVEIFPLDQANRALDMLRRGNISGAAVLVP